MLSKLIDCCVLESNRKMVENFIGNEEFHYVEPQHNSAEKFMVSDTPMYYWTVNRALSILGGICNLPWKWIVWNSRTFYRSAAVGGCVLPH